MSIITKIFDFEGGVRIAEIPPGTTTLTMHLYGGGGAGGGNELSEGGVGAAGHYVTVTDLDISSYAGVKNISVSVGGGGESGTTGAGADGGRNGKSLTNYSGGTGGKSGPNGPSGSGGGGGGATVVTVFDDGASVTQTVLAVAGGGGAGGGGAVYSTGGPGSNSNSATSATPGTLGQNGQLHSTNGGGGGAGGGGKDGGINGATQDGDVGGFGGTSGSNTVPAGGSSNDGSGRQPGGKSSGYYVTGVAEGGLDQKNGGDGRAVLIFTIPGQSYFKNSGVQKEINQIYQKVSNTWKQITAGYVKVGGVWKNFFTGDIIFFINYALFGNATGNPATGTIGADRPAAGMPFQPDDDPGGGRIVIPKAKKMYWGPITIPGGYQTKSNETGENVPNNPRVICTYFADRGEMDPRHLTCDYTWTQKNLGDYTKIGYWLWAIPLVQYLEKYDDIDEWLPTKARDITRYFAEARAQEISCIMGESQRGSALGKVVRFIGEPLCAIIGFIAKPFVAKRFANMLKDYGKEGIQES